MASSLAWLRSSAPADSASVADPNATLVEFERRHRPIARIDVGILYAGRAELIDPRRVLPTWHLHPRAQAAAVYAATRQCPPSPLGIELTDAALLKAYAWHRRTCGDGAPPLDD